MFRPMISARSFAKVLGLLFGGLMVFLLLVLGGFLLINAFDEPLNPRAQAALQARHDSIAPQDNLFFAVLGLNFEGVANVNDMGREAYAGYLEAGRANPGKPLSLYDNASFKKQTVVGDPLLLCGRSRRQEDCVERSRAHPDELRAALEANRPLVDRYKSVQKYVQLQNPVPLAVNSPILNWQIFLTAKRLWLTGAVLEAGDGHVDDAIDALGADFAFTRRVLAEPDILLIDKVILAVGARMDLMVISDLARNGDLTDRQYSNLALMITPLTEAQRTLAPVFAREFTAYASLFGPLSNPKNGAAFARSSGEQQWLPRLVDDLSIRTLKYNASLNEAWSINEKNQAASRGSCRNLPMNDARLAQSSPFPTIGYVYNPLGKLIVRATAYDGLEYIKSMCDLQGMVGIVALQLAIQVEHIQDIDIADFVKRRAESDGNPYTGQPLEWNEADGSLGFRPVAERNTGYFPWPITRRHRKEQN